MLLNQSKQHSLKDQLSRIHKSVNQIVFVTEPIKKTGLFPKAGILCFIEIPVSNANSVDPDQTLPFVASDLDEDCLLIKKIIFSTVNHCE